MSKKEIICGIYVITNIINGKFYIGSSKDIYCRWNKHKRDLNKNKHHNIHLQNSWNKNGEKNFEFDILEETLLENQFDIEQDFLNVFGHLDECFNMSLFAHGGLDFHTQETKNLLSVIASKRVGYLNPFFGKHHSIETKEILRVKSGSRKHSSKTKELMSSQRKGVPKSEEHKKKIKESQPIELHRQNSKEYWTDERREEMRELNKGKILCPENQRKVSINGEIYKSVLEATRILKMNRGKIRGRLDSNTLRWEKWFYIDNK